MSKVGGRSVTWEHDPFYRLTAETIAGAASANGILGYFCDPVGNRLSRTSTVPGIAAQAFTYDADDRLNSNAWDANGNTLASATSTYGYDSENRLVSLNASEAGYLYDGDGQLVRRTVGGVATTYLVDDQTPAGYTQIAEERVGGVVARSYVFGPQRISMRSADVVHWYTYDAHSGVRGLLDVAGAVTDTYEYDAFGSVVARTGTTENAFTYRGELMDSTLGLQYLRARWMDPSKGRLGTRDGLPPTDDPQHGQPYAYTYNSAVDRADPSGRDFSLASVSLGAAFNPALRLNPGRGPPRDERQAPGYYDPGTLLSDPFVRRELALAWRETHSGFANMREQGGSVLEDSLGSLYVDRWPAVSQIAIEPSEYPDGRRGGDPVVASFHTHPDACYTCAFETLPNHPSPRDLRSFASNYKGSQGDSALIISDRFVLAVRRFRPSNVVRWWIEGPRWALLPESEGP